MVECPSLWEARQKMLDKIRVGLPGSKSRKWVDVWDKLSKADQSFGLIGAHLGPFEDVWYKGEYYVEVDKETKRIDVRQNRPIYEAVVEFLNTAAADIVL